MQSHQPDRSCIFITRFLNTEKPMPKWNVFIAILLLAFGSAVAAEAPAKEAPVFKDGANCLFIGHSFFIPVARLFDIVAGKSGFHSHQVKLVFAPGKGGSPADLWNNPRHKKQIEEALKTGKVELLGMTAFGGLGSSFEDYQQWIDLALKHNPETRFFIGVGWTPGGPRLENDKFDKSTEAIGERMFKTITELRKAYPKNHIYFLNYGKVASELKRRYDAGKRPDVTKLSGLGDDVLFRDGLIGHGGPMMLEVSSLLWLNTLYGADIDNLKRSPYKSDVKEIVGRAAEYNQNYK